MNERIRRLRDESLKAVPSVSVERAVLVTEFYRSPAALNVSEPVKRALDGCEFLIALDAAREDVPERHLRFGGDDAILQRLT